LIPGCRRDYSLARGEEGEEQVREGEEECHQVELVETR